MTHPLDTDLVALDGTPLDTALLREKTVLVVNVASKCGFTPQYAALEKLHREYHDRDFSVLGIPCNQFREQEPGTAQEIADFCSTTYGVTFPITEKLDVNGESRHQLYDALTAAVDADGQAGDVKWNFEKFLVQPDGTVSRFRSRTEPDDPAVVAAIEASLSN